MKLTNEKDIEKWLNKMNISSYVINEDLTVDVNRYVDISNKNLSEIPVYFNVIDGYFNCSNNKLKSLEGSPIIVKGSFDCSVNKLESLENFPKKVNEIINCSKNNLKNLNYLPSSITTIICNYNEISEVNNFPKEVSGNIMMRFNKLSSIGFLPKKMSGHIDLYGNDIINYKTKISNFKYLVLNKDYSDDIDYEDVENNKLVLNYEQFKSFILFDNLKRQPFENKSKRGFKI